MTPNTVFYIVLIIIGVCLFLAYHHYLKAFNWRCPFRLIRTYQLPDGEGGAITLTFIELRKGKMHDPNELERSIMRSSYRMATTLEVDQLLCSDLFIPSGIYIVAHQGTGKFYRSTLVHGKQRKEHSSQLTSDFPIGNYTRYAVVPLAE